MNPIMLANMTAIMNRKVVVMQPPVVGFRLHKNSKSADIVKHLLINGKTDSDDLIELFDLSNTPQSYIQPHIAANRIILHRQSGIIMAYSIHPDLTPADFGLVL